MTREERERDRCAHEIREAESGKVKLDILLGWADWEIERQFLTPQEDK